MKLLVLLSLYVCTAHADLTQEYLIPAPRVPAVMELPDATPVDDPRIITGTMHLSLKEMKLACTNPGHFNNQNPPSKISVDCVQKVCQWSNRPRGRRASQRVTFYGGRVLTNKANVHMDTHYWRDDHAPRGETVPCFEMQFYCQKEVRANMMSCDELIKLDSLQTYCEANMLELDIESFSVKVNIGEAKLFCPGLDLGKKQPHRR